jgi:hypothetical protein
VRVRVTNTGTEAWSAAAQLVGGWEETDEPYLRREPGDLRPVGDVPALAPGESAVATVRLPQPPRGRGVAWISLSVGQTNTADVGSPALQVSTEAP